ncbi:CAI-1 autoinducer synthase [Grimontia hollisae]|uniref:alpha-hydroxyketone-type quorum-sensing autoinducer synthase n=1 Tax=Grimontia hollisae TaxID=673 RepID=UPI0006819BDF|nr:alpha-hydroxyketone-type quorum-sensing autoinducer synthase [Grimontia hollisae]AUW37774.1 CAI-1 autoinducer synthase [Grimontia hollisae]STO77639.1 CAI-1 autoinducer synthase [Grimontia hollisae]STQ76271.1 CAI-1 autoinducer synthase [Grimontia hollisae]
METPSTPSTSIYKKKLPSFVEARLNSFLRDMTEPYENRRPLPVSSRPGEGAVIMQSNDYLALSFDDDIQTAHLNAIKTTNENVVMSAVFLQDAEHKPEFEKRLAEFIGMDGCVLSQSGWTANVGLLQTICEPGTHVYIDFFAHMSLWEGARIAGAQVIPFMHNSVSNLKRQIKKHGPGIILVDSVYSTIGTVAPLPAICELAKELDCALVVDESHSLGTHGPGGSGLINEMEVRDQVDFVTTSLAKAFAYRAGAVLGPDNLIIALPFVSFPAIFSSTVLPQEVARLEATLDVIQNSDDKRRRLFEISDVLRAGLKEIGFNIRSESQIISLECGDEQNTEHVRDFLESKGVFGAVFCSPATPKNKAIIRFSLNADMSYREVDHVLTVCQAAYNHPDLRFY